MSSPTCGLPDAAPRPRRAQLVPLAAALACAIPLAACGGGNDDGATATASATSTVTLITHDSFAVNETLLDEFESQTGLTVKLVAPGDSGSMVSQIIMTKDNPMGDVVYGIDNASASRALDAGVLAPYTSPVAGKEQDAYKVGEELTAIDFSDVCLNVDHGWYRDKGIEEPATLLDLLDPIYHGQLVVENPATSSPGLAFLLATIGAFGEDGWQDYWTKLAANGVQVAPGWTEAYYTDFSGSEGAGPYPLVVSYASSPPVEVGEDGVAPTGALLDTCFRQVEYAGVLQGAANPEGAKKVIDFLLSQAFQEDLPEQMYVYPIDPAVSLPTDWVAYAPLATHPYTVEPQVIDANREKWIEQWTDLVLG